MTMPTNVVLLRPLSKSPGATLVVVDKLPVGQRGYSLPMAWEQAVRGWLEWLKLGGTRPSTINTRRGCVRYVARVSQTQHPGHLSLNTLVAIVSEKNWSNDHRKSMRTSLVSFFDWCVDNELAEFNVAEPLPKVRESKPRPRPATDEIWHELLEAAGPRERMMARLAGEVGMRRAEVAVCAREDLIRDGRGRYSLVVHGKGGRQRVVPVTNDMAQAIREFCPRGYLFPGQIVEPGHIDGHLSAHYVGKLISGLMPPTWSMHKLRHRYSYRGYAKTKDIRALQEALGHESVATTQRYTPVGADDVRAITDAAANTPPAGLPKLPLLDD